MKYIRIFEKFDKNNDKTSKYWLIPTDERFQKSLEDINCTDINYYLLNNQIPRNYYVFAAVTTIYTNSGDHESWGWNEFDGDPKNWFYDEYKYKFMGMVNIENLEMEIDIKRYNI